MAAINCEQQEFALHSLNDECKNKTFFFVKLTDSALKSIEDYMSLNPNLRQGIAKPTIQFHNNSNQGAITLPIPSNSNSGKNEIRYSFNLSNVDADGQQGSFEFLRQRKINKYEECIESLGSMFIKMQFQASDDIYQKTKVKMANAELDAKKHSTKVIKETGPNVGRKIKKTITSTGNTLTNSSNSLSGNIEKSSAYSSYKDLLSVNSTFENNQHSPKSSSSKFLNHNKQANFTSANKDETCLNSINHMTSSSKDNGSQQLQNSSTLNQLKSNTHSTANFNSTNSSSTINQIAPNPELFRKPIRDRVIHALALRPFKKPELLTKLNREGLKEKDRKGLSVLICQIAHLRDNAYHLHRGAWQEVQVDDWPFYTNEERELVRKRNPLSISSTNSHHINANQTTDLNSAINSSISPLATFDNQQQSPLMHHSNSPSSITNKRTIDQSVQNGPVLLSADYDYATANKKQRISHHKANIEQQGIKKRSPPLSNSITQNNASLISNSTLNQANSLRSIGSNTLLNNGLQSAKSSQVSSNKLTNKYDDVINIWENKPKTPDEKLQTNGHYANVNSNSHSSPEINSSVNSSNSNSNGLASSNKIGSSAADRTAANKKNGPINSYRNNGANLTTASSDRYHSNNISSYTNQTNYHHSNQFHHSSNNPTNSHFNSFSNHHYNNSNQQQHNSSLCSTPNSSPDSGTGSNDGSLASTSSSRSLNSTNEDYLSKYTEITSNEQFRKYKQDFNCEYEEYKKLHNIVDRNAHKFALLEQELRQAQEGTDAWNRIMERILREYEDIKRDSTYLNARSRMQYLHMKLSHIKGLILNYTNQTHYHKHGASGSSIKFSNSNGSRIRSRNQMNHSSVPPVQQSNRSKMITSS